MTDQERYTKGQELFRSMDTLVYGKEFPLKVSFDIYEVECLKHLISTLIKECNELMKRNSKAEGQLYEINETIENFNRLLRRNI